MRKFVLLLLILLSSLCTAEARANDCLLIPLYIYPGPQWDGLVNIKNTYGVNITAVANPESGPGTSQNSDYVTYINKLRDAGIKVVGYVYTSYGNRAEGDVKADIDRWYSFYSVDGIFFDEVSTSGDKVGYYQDLVSYLKSKDPDAVAVGNPGTFDSSTVSDYANVFDVLVIYEDEGYPSGSWYPSVNREKLAALAYNVQTFSCSQLQSVLDHVKYVYVTDDVFPNPWDSLASYINEEAACIAGVPPKSNDYVLKISQDGSCYSLAEHWISYDLSSGAFNSTLSATIRNWSGGELDIMYLVVNDGGSERVASFKWLNGWAGLTLYACYNADCIDTGIEDIDSTWHTLSIAVTSNAVSYYVDGNLVWSKTGLSISSAARVDVGSWDDSAVYDLYIDNIVEKHGSATVASENFDDSVDNYFNVYVGEVSMVVNPFTTPVVGNQVAVTGKFTVGNSAPQVLSFAFYVSDESSTTTEFMPTNQYWLYITISDDNTLDDISEITVKLFYDLDNTKVGAEPGSTDPKNYVILHYTRTAGSGGSWEFIDGSGASEGTSYGSWQIVDNADPTDWDAISGTFKVKFTVGKVAHEANTGGGDDWDAKVTAKDDSGASGSNQAYGYVMSWYGEITADDTSFNFGGVSLGTSNNEIRDPTDKNVDLTAIANGNYKIQVKAADTSGNNDYWAGQNHGGQATIVTSDPGTGEIRLKVDDDSDHSSGVVVIYPQSSGYNDWLTSLSGPTDESGAAHYAYLLLDIGPDGLQDDTYVGKVFFQITND